MTARARHRPRSGRSRPVRSTLAALFYSLVTGWGLCAIYVLVVARYFPATDAAAYAAAFLVVGAVLSTAVVAVLSLRSRAMAGRVLSSLAVFVAAFLALVPAWFLRLMPPAEVGAWLSGLVDSSISLPDWITTLDVTRVPVLGDKLVANEVWIALAVEIVFLMGVIYLLVWRGLRQTVCTSCGSPCEREQGVAYRQVEDAELARQRIERRSWNDFREAVPPEGGGVSLRFDLTTCPSCGGTNLLTVVVERLGRRDVPIVAELLLSRDDARTIERLGSAF